MGPISRSMVVGRRSNRRRKLLEREQERESRQKKIGWKPLDLTNRVQIGNCYQVRGVKFINCKFGVQIDNYDQIWGVFWQLCLSENYPKFLSS